MDTEANNVPADSSTLREKRVSFYEPNISSVQGNSILKEASKKCKFKCLLDACAVSPPMFLDLETTGLRRSKRLADKAKVQRDSQLESDSYMMCSFITTVCQFLQEQKFEFTSSLARFMFYVEVSSRLLDNTINKINVFSIAAKHEENETYSHKDMLKQKDAPRFIEAMQKEIDSHMSREH